MWSGWDETGTCKIPLQQLETREAAIRALSRVEEAEREAARAQRVGNLIVSRRDLADLMDRADSLELRAEAAEAELDRARTAHGITLVSAEGELKRREEALKGLAAWWLMRAANRATRPQRYASEIYRACAEALLAVLQPADAAKDRDEMSRPAGP